MEGDDLSTAQVGPWKGLWNPTKRLRKAVTDVSPSVLRRAVNFPDSQLTVISLPYLMIVNHVSSLSGAEMAEARQFMIAYTDGIDGRERLDPRVQFISHCIGSSRRRLTPYVRLRHNVG